MLSLLYVLLVGAVAGCQITETLHHGSIFLSLREKARQWSKLPPGLRSKAGELFECPFCLSHWSCAIAVTWLLLTPVGSPWQLPIVILAATRLAQLLNDATHGFTRSPPGDGTEPVEKVDQSQEVDQLQ